MKKWLLSVGILSATLASTQFFETQPIVAHAAGSQVAIGKEIKGSVSKTLPKKSYSFTTNENGKFTISVETKTNIRVRIYDGNGSNVFSEIQLYGSDATQATQKKSVYLDKGTYYIDVIGDGVSEGTFSFDTSFTKVNTNERESNNTLDLAQTITNGNQLKGIFSYKDRTDIYRLEMTKPGNLTMDLAAYMNMDMEIVDENKQVIVERSTLKGTESTAKKVRYPILLEEGVYYIKLYATDENTGQYSLKVNTELFDYSEALTNNLKDTAQPLQSGKTLMGSILSSDSTDWYVINVQKPTKWTVDFKSKVPAKLSIYSDESVPLEEYDLSLSSSNRTASFAKTYYLEKGQYYVRIDRKDARYGLYQLKSKTTTVSSNESGFNNTEQYAESLPLNKTKKGVMAITDVADVYAVKVSSKGYLSIGLKGNSLIGLSATDGKGYTVLNAAYIYGSASKTNTTIQTIPVKKGTYYIYVKKQPGYMGTYSIEAKTSTTNPVPKLTSVSTPKAGSTKVTGKATKGSTVQVKVGSKTYKAKANSKGVFTVKTSKLKKGAKLTIIATNNYGTSAKKTVTVKK